MDKWLYIQNQPCRLQTQAVMATQTHQFLVCYKSFFILRANYATRLYYSFMQTRPEQKMSSKFINIVSYALKFV